MEKLMNGNDWLKIFNGIDHRKKTYDKKKIMDDRASVTTNTDESESAFIKHRAKQLTMIRLLCFKENTFGFDMNMLIKVIDTEKFNPRLNHEINNNVLKQAHFISDQYYNQFLDAYRDSLKQEGGGKEQLTQKQIALIHVYNEQQITEENKDKIASDNKYKQEFSGKKILGHYNTFQKPNERQGDRGSKKKNENMKKLIESVLPYLSDSGKKTANEDIKKIIDILNKYY